MTTWETIADQIENLRVYYDDQIDVCDSPDGPTPNRAMALDQGLEEAAQAVRAYGRRMAANHDELLATTSALVSRHIDIADDLRRELDQQRTRAEAAEAEVAELRAEIAFVRADSDAKIRFLTGRKKGDA